MTGRPTASVGRRRRCPRGWSTPRRDDEVSLSFSGSWGSQMVRSPRCSRSVQNPPESKGHSGTSSVTVKPILSSVRRDPPRPTGLMSVCVPVSVLLFGVHLGDRGKGRPPPRTPVSTTTFSCLAHPRGDGDLGVLRRATVRTEVYPFAPVCPVHPPGSRVPPSPSGSRRRVLVAGRWTEVQLQFNPFHSLVVRQ